MDEDLDLGNSTKRSARQGRRAKKEAPPLSAGPEPTDDAAEEESMPTGDSGSRDADAPPRPSRKMSGWGEDSMKSRRRRGVDDNDEDDRLRPRTIGDDDKDDESDNDIPVIPDLEDQQEEDIGSSMAMAPNVAVNRVATYRELDNDLLRHAAFLTLDGEVDLKLLAKGLSSEADVQEEDVMWDWDRLFTEVTSELLSEWEARDAPLEEKTAA